MQLCIKINTTYCNKCDFKNCVFEIVIFLKKIKCFLNCNVKYLTFCNIF